MPFVKTLTSASYVDREQSKLVELCSQRSQDRLMRVVRDGNRFRMHLIRSAVASLTSLVLCCERDSMYDIVLMLCTDSLVHFREESDIHHSSSGLFKCGTIRRRLKTTRKGTKLKFYKVVAVPMLMYGAEFWVLNKKEERRIEAAEMKFFRGVAGYTLWDRKRNDDIRKELKIFKLTEKIFQYRNDWMENDCIPKLILNYKPNGVRNVGRPRRRWIQQL
ncbi:hypothetical protein ANN_04819 [Periplaneta americana]|uniref:Uncharacterized protein n=1 Tax=Periplaneta americana TaxID=6978 RepID=A0ABQ8T9J6_PERAM|nr:hypothetical protein ANN_04819 [Periplaneta americana]